MKIERKEGIGKIKITYNKKIFWTIIILFIILIGLIYAIVNSNNKEKVNFDCSENNECVPASCCHAESCISSDKAPVCNRTVCTQECSSTLDCGQGSCGCINNKCTVIKK